MMDVRQQLIQYDDVIIVGGGDRTSSWIWQPMLNRVECVREVVLAEGGIAVFPDNPLRRSIHLSQSARHFTTWSGSWPDRRVNRISSAGQENHTRSSASELRRMAPELTHRPARMDNGVMLTGYRVEQERLYCGGSCRAAM
jgi:hypothetical protein